MPLSLNITAKHVNLSPELEAEIRAETDKLDQFFDRIGNCQVTVEGPGGHHRHGRHSVKIVAAVPQGELVVSRQSDDTLAVAMSEAFTAMGRQVEDHVRKLRGDVKTLEERPVARVAKLFADYGFLDADGREVYFHRNSVLPPGFDRLTVGTRVRYHEEMGDQGAQASSLSIVGRSH